MNTPLDNGNFSSHSRKRRFQFAMVSLLVAPFIVAICLGRYSARIRDYWYARALEENGAILTLDEDGFVEAISFGASTSLKNNRVLQKIGSSDHVVHVEFNMTQVDNDVLSGLRKFPKMTSLSLINTGISDQAMYSLRSLHKIERLDIHGEGITKNGLRHLCDLPYLQYLNLGGCDISSDDLQPLTQCRGLKYLYLAGCPNVDDSAIPYIVGIPTLEVVEIISTGFSSEGGQRLDATVPSHCFVQGVLLPRKK